MRRLNNPQNRKKLKYLFYGSLLLFALMDLLVPRKPYFWFDGLPGFYAIFGVVMCILTIIICKALGYSWLMVREDYYDNDKKGGKAS
ncbi:MAG: hypothetical protein AAGB97_01170 [Dehalococcoidia bacterium]|nr:hypothetical protein [Chloroflexota bacterium]